VEESSIGEAFPGSHPLLEVLAQTADCGRRDSSDFLAGGRAEPD
jgi:hypothetical protein